MATYGVTFVQNHVYWVEANNKREAESKAYAKFKNDIMNPVANHIYDYLDEVEVIVDKVIKNEKEKEQ